MRIMLLAVLVSACQREVVGAGDVRLSATSHAPDTFDVPEGRAQVEAFVTRWPKRPTVEVRRAMNAALRSLGTNDAGAVRLRSVYVFRRSDTLSELDPRAPLLLKSERLLDVVAFARWSNGTLDMQLLVDEGDAVFDLLNDAPIAEPWEFR